MQLQYYSAIIEDILEKQKQISSLESILIKLKVGKQDQLMAQYCLIGGWSKALLALLAPQKVWHLSKFWDDRE